MNARATEPKAGEATVVNMRVEKSAPAPEMRAEKSAPAPQPESAAAPAQAPA